MRRKGSTQLGSRSSAMKTSFLKAKNAVLSKTPEVIDVPVALIPENTSLDNSSVLSEMNSDLERINTENIENNLGSYLPFRKNIKNINEIATGIVQDAILDIKKEIDKIKASLDDDEKAKKWSRRDQLSMIKQLSSVVEKFAPLDQKYSPATPVRVQHDHFIHSASLSDEELAQKELELASILGKNVVRREVKFTETRIEEKNGSGFPSALPG